MGGTRMSTWKKLAIALGVAALCAAVAVPFLVSDDKVAAAAPPAPALRESKPIEAKPEPEPPKVAFSRTMYASSTATGFDPYIDACAGPVAIDLGGELPTLVSEHDYCGGSDWIPKVNVGDAVELKGDGVEAGIYEARSLKNAPRHVSTTQDLPAGEVVLQTCISATEMVFVALEKIA